MVTPRVTRVLQVTAGVTVRGEMGRGGAGAQEGISELSALLFVSLTL